MSTTAHESLTVPPRPLRADAARNREKVLTAARSLFAEHGREVQMEDLARRAGVGVGTIYRHFPTKEALVDAIATRRWEEIAAHLDAECLPRAETFAGMEAMLRHAGEIQARDRMFCDVVEAITGGDPKSGEAFAAVDTRVGELLRRGHEAGVLRPGVDGDTMRTVFCGLAAVVRSGADWQAYVEIVLDGLRAR